MKTLRELMTSEIKRDGWLDFVFKRQHPDNVFGATADLCYAAWLDSLSDSDFLDSYNQVKQAANELD